jgi:hypothetical protein
MMQRNHRLVCSQHKDFALLQHDVGVKTIDPYALGPPENRICHRLLSLMACAKNHTLRVGVVNNST